MAPDDEAARKARASVRRGMVSKEVLKVRHDDTKARGTSGVGEGGSRVE